MKKTFEFASKHKAAALTALILAAGASAPLQAAETTPYETAPYAMAVISNEAHGKKVQSGKYEEAIDRITRSGRRDVGRFSGLVNLCVAYTKSSDIEKATTACDGAIAAAKRASSHTDNDAELALALSNHGVLMAATGNVALAEQDFLSAIELRSRLTPLVVNNLERLGKGGTS